MHIAQKNVTAQWIIDTYYTRTRLTKRLILNTGISYLGTNTGDSSGKKFSNKTEKKVVREHNKNKDNGRWITDAVVVICQKPLKGILPF